MDLHNAVSPPFGPAHFYRPVYLNFSPAEMRTRPENLLGERYAPKPSGLPSVIAIPSQQELIHHTVLSAGAFSTASTVSFFSVPRRSRHWMDWPGESPIRAAPTGVRIEMRPCCASA